jgi:hypothetical protein
MSRFSLTDDQKKLLCMLVTLAEEDKLLDDSLVEVPDPDRYAGFVGIINTVDGTFRFNINDFKALCKTNPPLMTLDNHYYRITEAGYDVGRTCFVVGEEVERQGVLPTRTGHLFISYAREDQAYTRKLADDLRAGGFETWMDDRIDFGDRWWQMIVQAIRASAAFIVVMTPDAEQSKWVEREILLAQREGKSIFPLLLRGQEFPLLIEVQYADVSDGQMPPTSFYERLARAASPKRKDDHEGEGSALYNIEAEDKEIRDFIDTITSKNEIRDFIDAITSKVVLILGRFTPERKAVLDALREELRRRNYSPILFDFEKPSNRDLSETISTLAHMARFVIADITDAKSIPQELERIVPSLPSVPVQPLIASSQYEYGMFEHFRRYSWVLETYRYDSLDGLLGALDEKVIGPAERKAKELTGKT